MPSAIGTGVIPSPSPRPVAFSAMSDLVIPAVAPGDDPAASGGTTDEIDVSIVLPVYNEKGHLRQEIDRIRAAMDASEFSYEMIVIDDGSSDGSGEALREIEGIRLIQFLTNRGSGSARKYGTRASRGAIVVWTDVDMSYPNDLIPELIREMEGYDQVVGARTTEEGTHKLFRVPAKAAIRKLASYLVQTPIPDLNSGMRAFRKDVALQYVSQLPPGFSCVTTITMTFLAHGYTVKYWPITYSERAGTSKFHWASDTRRYLLQVIRMTLSFDPFRVFLPIGFLFTFLGAGQAHLRHQHARLPGGHQHGAHLLGGLPGVRHRHAGRPHRAGDACHAGGATGSGLHP